MTPSPLHWPDAALTGVACGMRSLSGPGLLAVRGAIPGRARYGVLALSAGELAADKTPVVPSRTTPPALGGRAVTGALSGRAVAGLPGAAVGAAAAVAGTYASGQVRSSVVERPGCPTRWWRWARTSSPTRWRRSAPATSATTRTPSRRSRPTRTATRSASPTLSAVPTRSPLRDALAGFGAGLAGTAAMTLAQTALLAVTGGESSDAPAQAADTIKRRLGKGRLRRKHRPAANVGMHWLYGTSWGIPYGIVAAGAKTAPEVSGPVFGLIVWGVGLVQQPALGVAEVPWKRSLSSLGLRGAGPRRLRARCGRRAARPAQPRLTGTRRRRRPTQGGAPSAARTAAAKPQIAPDRLNGRMYDCRTN